MTAVIMLVVTLILVPLLLAEFTDWLPWVASRLILRAANHLPVERRGRYTEEWAAEFNALPGGKLNKLLFGLRIYARARITAQVLREELEAEQKQPRMMGADPDAMDTAARVLSLAQQTADYAIADARREADATLGRARREAGELLARARRDAEQITREARNATPE